MVQGLEVGVRVGRNCIKGRRGSHNEKAPGVCWYIIDDSASQFSALGVSTNFNPLHPSPRGTIITVISFSTSSLHISGPHSTHPPSLQINVQRSTSSPPIFQHNQRPSIFYYYCIILEHIYIYTWITALYQEFYYKVISGIHVQVKRRSKFPR